jgi:hypothetical protein
MKSFKLLMAFAAFATLAFTACNSGSTTKDAARESLATTNTTTTPAATPQATPEANIPAGPLTTVSFPETIFDFGEIEEGEKVTHVYAFKNTGTHPLIISNAKGSCGCTVPDWPREPIPPGESGEIKVQYDSKGKGQPEGRAESKRVTITANTDPANSYLTIKGKVFKPAAPES